MRKVAFPLSAPPILLAGLCLCLYLVTLAPGQLGGDAGELQLVPATLSLAHPTGYPLHSLLGKVWVSMLPVGSVAWRMNLLAACAAALCVGLLCDTLHRLTQSWLAGILGGLALALSPIFWGQAVLADKYILNAALLSAVLWAVVREAELPGQRRAALTAFLYGLSLTHHRSMLVFGPLLFAHWVRLYRLNGQWRRAGLWLQMLACLVLPLGLYAYLPFAAARNLPPNLWHPANMGDWWVYLSDQSFVAAVRPDQSLFGNLHYYAQTLRDQFGWSGLLLGLLGLGHQLVAPTPNRRWLGVGLLFGFVTIAVLTSSYQVFRNWVFFIPTFVVFSIWVGAGIAAIAQWAARNSRIRQAGYGLAMCAGLSILVPAFVGNFPRLRSEAIDGGAFDLWRNDLKHGYQAQRFVQNSLPWVQPNSWILADWEQATPLWYAQQIDSQRRDVSVFFPLELLSNNLIAQHPVYIGRTYPSLGDTYHYSAQGALLRVTAAGDFDVPTDLQPASAVWDDAIALAGYRLYQTDLRSGQVLPVSLYFRAIHKPAVNYAVSIRFFNESGQQIAQEDRDAFALGMSASTHWEQGEVIGDYFELSVPNAGRYQIAVLLYEKMPDGQLRNATLAPAGSDTVLHRLPWVTLGK